MKDTNAKEQPVRTGPRVALLAHDTKRDELIGVLKAFLPELRRCKLVATHITGITCSQQLGLEIELLQSSVKGGDLQVGALVTQRQLDAVIYLRDALFPPPYAPDIAPLHRVCDIYDVPIATNKETAIAVLARIKSSLTPSNGTGAVAHRDYAPRQAGG